MVDTLKPEEIKNFSVYNQKKVYTQEDHLDRLTNQRF
jgi:hypothetical protein